MRSARSPSSVYWFGDNLYLNITNRCSNNCYFCIKKFKEGVGGFNLRLSTEPSADEVIKELQNIINKRSWKEIVFCGFGEPLERLDCLLEVSRWIKKHYGKIVSIRVDTNGQALLLNSGREVLKELKEAGVEKISVSLNAHDKEAYMQICRPEFANAFESILEFIEKAKENFALEITAVAIPEADISKIKAIAQKMEAKFRVRAYIPCSW